MKNLKLFTIPLVGAAFLVACGPKPMDVKDFKEKVRENYKAATLESYEGMTQKAAGTPTEYVMDRKIVDFAEPTDSYPNFLFENTEVVPPVPVYVLSVEYINYIEQGREFGYNFNYFISGETYIVEMSAGNAEGNMSQKLVFNKDLVATHYEMKMSGGGKSQEMNLDFKYE